MRFDSLSQWLAWQQSLHPRSMDFDLQRIGRVWDRLGRPAVANTVISVAGTNGKGSCIAYLESIYRQAGYRVGSYTSPHLYSYTERIRVQGRCIDPQLLCQLFAEVDRARGDISLTYFEFGTLAALLHFSAQQLDLALLEVGLGGRLDAVNIIDADIAVLTSIGLDHQQWLGRTREQIGYEKAGILRAGIPAVCADAAPPDSVLRHARRLEVPLLIFGRHYQVQTDENGWRWIGAAEQFRHDYYALPWPSLRGRHQLANAAAAVAVVELNSGRFPLPVAAVRQGLAGVKLPGRFEVVPGSVDLILDVAHNQHSARALAQNLAAHGCRGRSRALFALLDDKDIDAILDEVWEQIDDWYLVALDDPRAMDLKLLQTHVRARKLHGEVIEFADAASACEYVDRHAGAGDRVVVFGSFVLAGRVGEIWAKLKHQGECFFRPDG